MPGMPMRTGGSEEQQRLSMQLSDLHSALELAGRRALMYCGVCRKKVTSFDAVIGPVQEWPYCPIHPDKPLMFSALSLNFYDTAA